MNRKIVKNLFSLILIFGLLACGPSGFEPEYAEPIEPPPHYEIWWEELVQCVDERYPVFSTFFNPSFERITWWKVPGGPWWSEKHKVLVAGMWDNDRNIYIAETYLFRRRTIVHEMAHDLGFRHPKSIGPPYPWPFEGC